MSEAANGAQISGGNIIICRSEMIQHEMPKESWKQTYINKLDIKTNYICLILSKSRIPDNVIHSVLFCNLHTFVKGDDTFMN